MGPVSTHVKHVKLIEAVEAHRSRLCAVGRSSFASKAVVAAVTVTTARRNDLLLILAVMDKTRVMPPWFKSKAALADRGYYAMTNYEHLHNAGTVPVILFSWPSNTDSMTVSTPIKACRPVRATCPMQRVPTDPKGPPLSVRRFPLGRFTRRGEVLH